MRKVTVIILALALAGGCATIEHSTVVGTDAHGNATGEFRDVRHGCFNTVTIWAAGAGASEAASSAAVLTGSIFDLAQRNSSNSSGSGAGGMLGIRISPPPTQGDPVPFARSIAMINYSKKLKRIKYDETGDILEYVFDDSPSREAPAPTFGRQPIR
ncbi:MAG: hypothetical protein WHT07_03140 [Desulfobaccales bacterium]